MDEPERVSSFQLNVPNEPRAVAISGATAPFWGYPVFFADCEYAFQLWDLESQRLPNATTD